MNVPLSWMLTACWAVAMALAAGYVAAVAQEITYVTLADGRRTERRLPLVFRMLLPFTSNFARVVDSPRLAAQRAAAERLIVSSGLEGLLSGREFLALKYLVPLAFGLVWTVVVQAVAVLLPESFFAQNRLVLMFVGFLAGYVYPLAWLRRARAQRHLAIFKALPFVLDLLTLSVEAGMDFIGALQRNCARGAADPLNEELVRMLHEIQVGTPRRVALRQLAARVDQTDLRSVVYALVQADELGVSIGSILRIQSEQLRRRRFDRAEQLAQEAPVKMLGPLLLCIFPAVFIILLGPILAQAAANLF